MSIKNEWLQESPGEINNSIFSVCLTSVFLVWTMFPFLFFFSTGDCLIPGCIYAGAVNRPELQHPRSPRASGQAGGDLYLPLLDGKSRVLGDSPGVPSAPPGFERRPGGAEGPVSEPSGTGDRSAAGASLQTVSALSSATRSRASLSLCFHEPFRCLS